MIFCMHIMYPFGMKVNFAKISAWAAVISFLLIPVIAAEYKDFGMACIMVAGELIVTLMAYRHINSKGFKFFAKT